MLILMLIVGTIFVFAGAVIHDGLGPADTMGWSEVFSFPSLIILVGLGLLLLTCLGTFNVI